MDYLAECTPEDAFSIVGDNIIYASGSPFHDVNLGTLSLSLKSNEHLNIFCCLFLSYSEPSLPHTLSTGDY